MYACFHLNIETVLHYRDCNTDWSQRSRNKMLVFSRCYCVRKDGTKIEGYSASIATKDHVTCRKILSFFTDKLKLFILKWSVVYTFRTACRQWHSVLVKDCSENMYNTHTQCSLFQRVCDFYKRISAPSRYLLFVHIRTLHNFINQFLAWLPNQIKKNT